jgi:hypothetical protein
MLLQTCEAIGKEAFSPEPDQLTAGVQARRDLVVAHSFGCVEDHLGSLHLKIR